MKEVSAPMKVTRKSVLGLFSNKIEQRTIKKTPAVTSVAAWMSAETGVGPSMASGNQMCNPICADFPTDPQKSNDDITVSLSKSKENIESVLFSAQGTRAKTVV